MRPMTGWWVAGLAVLALAGCAGPAKLAKKSQEQLAAGEPRKAYRTALKAVGKDAYNAPATAALRASGQAVLNHEAGRFKSLLVAHDTLAAAGVALDMDDVRRTVARYGITLAGEPGLATDERAARGRAAAEIAAEADVLVDAGRPKPAVEAYDRALTYAPEDARLIARRRAVHDQAMDRVLLLPYVCDTRVRLDDRALSDDMLARLTRYAADNLEFTELVDAGLAWNGLVRRGPSWFTRDAAAEVGEEHDASRVAWSRIHGDRVESSSQVVDEIVWRKVGVRQPDGTTVTRWESVPVRVRIEDRWISVAVECEVYSLADRRVVARRTTDHGTGLRLVSALTPLPGDADDYALYTPEQWTADRAGCRSRTAAWSEAFGGLTVEQMVAGRRDDDRGRGSGPRPERHGSAKRGGRSYDVGYGRPPREGELMQEALEDAWRELADVLAEADRT